eukprot:4645043-Amphidinium_carterae.3
MERRRQRTSPVRFKRRQRQRTPGQPVHQRGNQGGWREQCQKQQAQKGATWRGCAQKKSATGRKKPPKTSRQRDRWKRRYTDDLQQREQGEGTKIPSVSKHQGTSAVLATARGPYQDQRAKRAWENR